MFFDERIQAEQGKAFRATMILAWFITLVYGLLHTIFMLAIDNFYTPILVVELICFIAGLVLLLYGEIKYLTASKDEMKSYEKNLYYKKAFYLYLGIMLFAYYLRAVINMGGRYEGLSPNHFLITLEIPCWLLLLTYFKCNGVPFNYSYLAENKSTYIRRTFANVGKLAQIVALATGAGAFTLIIFGSSFVHIIAILASGLLSWFSLTIEYLIISWADRVSDKASESNRISSATVIFLFAGVIIYLISAAIGIYANWDNGSNITNGITAMLISTTHRYFSQLSLYFLGLFSVYLHSEIRHIHSKLLGHATKLIMGLIIFEFIKNPLSQLLFATIDSINVKLALTAIQINTIIGYVILILKSVALMMAAAAIVKKNMRGKSAYIYPTLVMLSSISIHLWAMQSYIGVLVEYVVFSALAVWMCVIVFLGYRAGKKSVRALQ